MMFDKYKQLIQICIRGVVLLATVSLVHADTPKLNVFAVNYPLAYFVERIGGEQAELFYPIPSDTDPAFWKPTTDDLIKIQQMDLIFLNGAGYARWTSKVSLPLFKTVNTSEGFKDDYIDIQQTTTHQHGLSGEHSHAGIAFTTWLDFSQADMQAKAVMQALIKKRPEYKQYFEDNFEQLSMELLGLDSKLKEFVNNKPVLASHPVYQYLARRYGLSVHAMAWEPDLYPSDAEWYNLNQHLKSYPATWMLWEAEPYWETHQRLQSLGIRAIVFTPCMSRPASGDFMSVMQQNVERLIQIYQ